VFWGFLHGAYQIIGEITLPIRNSVKKIFEINTETKIYKIFQIICTFILVNIGWIFFRAPGFRAAIHIGWHIIKDGLHPWIFFDETIYKLGLNEIEFNIAVIAIIILLVADIFQYINPERRVRTMISSMNIFFKYVFYIIAIFSILIFGVYGPEHNAQNFIYFQF
jgi:hypothetical protein